MRHDPLFNLIRNAEPSGPATRAGPDDLADRAVRRHRIQHTLRSASTLTALVLLAVSAALLVQSFDPPRHVEKNDPSPEEVDFQISSSALDGEIALHTVTAELLVNRERRRRVLDRSQLVLSREDVLDVVTQQRDAAALMLVAQADRLDAERQWAEAAPAVYRRTIELFPDTPAARIAAQRLQRFDVH